MRYLTLFLALTVATSASWAQSAGKQLLIQQWVAPDANGRIDVGILAPGREMPNLGDETIKVSLVSQEGEIYDAFPSDASPYEQHLLGVPAGIYTLVARGPNMVASYAVHVLDNDGNLDPKHNQLLVATAELRINKIRNAAIRYMPSAVPYVSEFAPAAGRKVMESLSLGQTLRVAQVGGGFSGQIFRAGLGSEGMAGSEQVNVLIYQNRELKGQAMTSGEGKFTVEALSPGQYALIAIGGEGFAVVGFTLVDELVAKKQKTSQKMRLVAFQSPAMQPSLELQLAPAGLESAAVNELLNSPQNQPPAETVPPAEPAAPAAEMASAGPGSGGGGFSGGGGSGSGLGGVAGLGLLGLGAAALVSDDDGGVNAPPVASPLAPHTP